VQPERKNKRRILAIIFLNCSNTGILHHIDLYT
jgi:hypothetical protein